MKALIDFISVASAYTMYVEPHEKLVLIKLNNNLPQLGVTEIKYMLTSLANSINMYRTKSKSDLEKDMFYTSVIYKNFYKNSLEAFFIIKEEYLNGIGLSNSKDFNKMMEDLKYGDFPVNFHIVNDKVRFGDKLNLSFEVLSIDKKTKVLNEIEHFLINNEVEVLVKEG